MSAVRKGLVDLCIGATITIALLLGLELSARAISGMKAALVPDTNHVIRKQAWGRQYAADETGLAFRYMEYVEFREQAYGSATINVDREGRRVVPGNCAKEDAFTVWTFGGSTMFGYGVPDKFTIPAYLARMLDDGGLCARIVNFGAGAWRSSQSLIHLVENLKRTRRPDAVVFYDGINDVGAVADGGRPGGIDPDDHLRLNRAFLELGILETIANGSTLVRVVSHRIFPGSSERVEQSRATVRADISASATATAALYAQNVRMADALAKEYGFVAYYFLQPYPWISQKKTTGAERAVFAELADNSRGYSDLLKGFYSAFRQEATLKKHPRYFDLSGIFDGLTQELFVDDQHLLPEGNRIVAQRIAKEILRQGGKPQS